MEKDTIAALKQAIWDYDSAEANRLAKESLEAGVDPLETLDALTEAIRVVGTKFGTGELFLPELIAAAEAMSKATTPLEEEIKEQGKTKKSLAKVVVGTVFGDIHDIGKNMVATLFKASGFDVVDCGVNVKADAFLQKVGEENADILALSALLTTTAPEQRKTINALKEAGIRDKVKVIVGGGGITRKFADDIGADGYDATASGAVGLCKNLMGIE